MGTNWSPKYHSGSPGCFDKAFKSYLSQSVFAIKVVVLDSLEAQGRLDHGVTITNGSSLKLRSSDSKIVRTFLITELEP